RSRPEQDVEITEVDQRPLLERDVEVGRPGPDDDPGRDPRDQEFEREPGLAAEARMVRLLDLVVIVEPADQPEARSDEQARPDVGIGEVHPQQHRDDDGDEDEEAAHGRGAALGEMALRPVGADRLALALAYAQPADELRPEQQTDDERGRARRPGAEADVADEVEEAGESELFGDHVEHATPPATRSTSFASPTEFDALTS